jgi:hypothetical protein
MGPSGKREDDEATAGPDSAELAVARLAELPPAQLAADVLVRGLADLGPPWVTGRRPVHAKLVPGVGHEGLDG